MVLCLCFVRPFPFPKFLSSINNQAQKPATRPVCKNFLFYSVCRFAFVCLLSALLAFTKLCERFAVVQKAFCRATKKDPMGLFSFLTAYCGKFPDSKNVTLSSFSPISSGHKTTISETFVCVLFWVIFMAKHSLASCFSKTIG